MKLRKIGFSEETWVNIIIPYILLPLYLIIMLVGFTCSKAHGQELTQTQLIQKANIAKVGDVLSRAGSTEIKKAPAGQLTAKVYGSPQWDMTGEPLVKYDNETGKIIAKSRYVKFFPDVQTANLDVRREIGNTGVKEYYTVPDKSIIRLSWTVDTDAVKVIFSKGTLTFRAFADLLMFQTLPPVSWDADKKPVEVKVTYVDKRLTYDIIGDNYTYPLTIDPTSVIATNDGYVRAINATYITARDATAGGYTDNTGLKIGQDTDYGVYRLFNSYTIPNMTTLTAASLFLNGSSDGSTTDFEIYVLTSTYSNPLVVADFDQFAGWQASGAYNGTVLNDVWNSSSYSADWNEIVFNAAGLTAIAAKKNSTLLLAEISKEDYDNSVPTANETIIFKSSATAGEEPYLSLTFTLATTNTRSILSKDGVITPIMTDGIITPLWKP